MALQGTIKDFALPDIFQLIGMQRKTGILTLANGEDTVTIKFLEGHVVGADAQSVSIEGRIGEVLVRTGRITQAQLNDALKRQRETLQRLGHILVRGGHISEDELVEALRVQSGQIIYRLFRWREGEYSFAPDADIEYDQAHFVPISSETILMEGARMIDEWPIIERRIKSERMVLRLTESARALSKDDESILENDIDFHLDEVDQPPLGEGADEATGAISLDDDERRLLGLVDGRRTVGEITDLSTLGEFDTCRILSDLVTRQLIEPVSHGAAHEETGVAEIVARLARATFLAALAVSAALALATLPANHWTPWSELSRSAPNAQLNRYASMARLERLEEAIQVFFLDTGTLPRSTTVLAQNGYLAAGDLFDPWGRPYQLELSSGGYRLSGLDARGAHDPELTVARRFNAVQRMMLADSPDEGSR